MTEATSSISNSPGAGRLSPNPDKVFRSFWMGGFEGADHINGFGRPLDLVSESGHLLHLESDYESTVFQGIRAVRESVGWRISSVHATHNAGHITYDFTRAAAVAETARRHGVQVLWSLMHYGTAPMADLHEDSFIERFVEFAVQAARTLGPMTHEPPVYTLINEINFVAWAVSETNMIYPYRGEESGPAEERAETGFRVKKRLVAATLAAMRAIKQEDARARFLHVEPILHVVAPRDRPDLEGLARQVREFQWQAWDMLAGRTHPELGGTPQALDLLGVNHYHSGQWEVGTNERLHWHLGDKRRMPLWQLLAETQRRYSRPLIVAETSHVGVGRADWFHETAAEVERALHAGVAMEGVCIYPFVDRPDWSDPQHWHNSGLWDVDLSGVGEIPLRRILHEPYAQCLGRWQARLPNPQTKES